MRRTSIALAQACALACTTNDGSLEIFKAIPVSTDCAWEPDSNVYVSRGVYDPRGFPGWAPLNYTLGLLVHNTIQAETDADVAGDMHAYNVEIISFDACWFPAHPGSDGEPEFADYVDGVPDNLTCDKLPDEQKGTLVTSAPVDAGGKATATVGFLDTAALQHMYGAGFEPWNIPDAGAIRVRLGTAEGWWYSQGASDPSDLGSRHPAWGNFPAQTSARVIVQLRANGVLLSGGTVQSNWFLFPVDICVGCMAMACGLQTLEECTAGDVCADGNACPPAGECADGSSCWDSCADGSPCPAPQCNDGTACQPGTWLPGGSTPDLTEACLPSQDQGPACIDLAACGDAADGG